MATTPKDKMKSRIRRRLSAFSVQELQSQCEDYICTFLLWRRSATTRARQKHIVLLRWFSTSWTRYRCGIIVVVLYLCTK